MKYRRIKKVTTGIFILSIILGLSACKNSDDCSTDTNCADYYSQFAAQAAFDADPVCRADLDADKDGMACEDWESYYNNLGSGGSGGCPNTAACGCSGYSKSQCQTKTCCKWTTGQGCGCR